MLEKKAFYFFFYRYRFLGLYTFFGLIALAIELLVIRSLQSFNLYYPVAYLLGFVAGLIIAFFLNIRFNFHIAPPKRKKALFYFTVISFLSFCIQLFFRQELVHRGMSLDLSRFVIAGAFFLISYFLHRKFSFKEYKKVGVAIYADGVEDIKKIFNSIGMVCDFIHLDIVDRTFKPDCKEVKAYRAEVVRAYWQKKPIEVHIMSKEPSKWLPDLLPYVDTIYVHSNIDEDLEEVLSMIRAGNCNAGLVIGGSESIETIEPYLNKVNHVLLLAIKNPGFSGQQFNMDTLQLIEKFSHHPLRRHITICVDGGVNDTTIQYINVESVVSGSFVLNAANPIKNIMYLQTSGEYEKF
jgi:ribulose-phosphate 3-epimerase